MKLNPIGSNQTVVEFEKDEKEIRVLFSYKTPVACGMYYYRDGRFVQEFYRTSQKFSVTTSKHINQWLGGWEAEEKPQEFFDNLMD